MNSEFTRRDAILGGTAAFTAAIAASPTRAQEPTGLKSELLFKMHATLQSPQQIGKTHEGTRIVFYATGGTIDGPKIKGKVLPGGGDWYRQREDGIGELDVRATIETDDGALIYTHYRGVTNGATGYFRTTPRFETASEKYQWLTQLVAVGVGRAGDGGVYYDVYHIL